MSGHILDEVELAGVGPMHVLEHQQGGQFDPQAFHESPRREQQEGLLVRRGIEPQPEHQRQ
jgi:hypothetical protein